MDKYINFNLKNKVETKGKMSTEGADSAGKLLAVAALITGFLVGVAMIRFAVGTIS